MSNPSVQPRRRRGAQPGNSNRFKHGLYSRSAKARRMAARRLVQMMPEALKTLRAYTRAWVDLNARPMPEKKKHEIEHRMALAFFQSVGALSERAALATEAAFEPHPAPAATPAQATAAEGSNAAPDAAHLNPPRQAEKRSKAENEYPPPLSKIR